MPSPTIRVGKGGYGMVSNAEKKGLIAQMPVAERTRLTALEKGLLLWSIVDPGDKVLDVCTTDGGMLSYLQQAMDCEVCGMSSEMESIRRSRARLQSADIAYAVPEDIPWHDDSFDIVYLRGARRTRSITPKALEEALRVLKAGGQLLVGARSYPALAAPLLNRMLSEEDNADVYTRQELTDALKQIGCVAVGWERVSLDSGVAIGWKPSA